MHTTRVFKSGNSMAIRLPKGFQILDEKVEIINRGDEIVIRNIPKTLGKAYDLLRQFPEDCFPEGSASRNDAPPQKREGL